ncbi:MAG: transcriptional repressor [Treponema sp.]|nr:transcriptional repressor [Treponema sp.]
MPKTVYKTKQQELLFTYLRQMQGKHFTAEDVRLHFEEKKISIGIATIYRQLEKLVADGKIQKYFIDDHSAACFEYAGEDCTEKEQHFHLKCELCGRLIHLECNELKELGGHLKTEHGFVINPLRTVFYGVCTDCLKKQEEEEDD